MVTLTYNPISVIDIDKIIIDIKLYKPDRVIICNELEWELRQLTPNFIQFCNDNNVDLKIIFGSFDDDYYDNLCSQNGLDKSNLIFWNTYWINWAEHCLRSEIDYKSHIVNTNFKYPFISLNNKNHLHRQIIVDHLAKYNLIDKGIVTWHKFSNQHTGYKFQYYDDSIRVLDDDFVTKLDSFLIPRQWHESFFHVIGEATHYTKFITEKVIIPILLKKPFAVLSKKGYNKCLTSLGFKLYDELIDYSYDDVDDLIVAGDLLCKNIQNITGNYAELYELLRPKIEYNYNRCLEIIKDINYIPLIIQELTSNTNDITNNLDCMYGRYKSMIENCHD